MKTSRFTDRQIIAVLKQAQAAPPSRSCAVSMESSSATFYAA